MMITDCRRGLYIHVPFCVRKCNYCDFCSFVGMGEDVKQRYISALIKEAEYYTGRVDGEVSTVFFGGGTPSLICPSELSRALEEIGESIPISKDAEITLEANPGTLTEESLRGYRAAGFNRISIGLQSIHDNELKKLGRIHNYNDFLQSYSLCRKVGFDNIGVDLMYGIPEQSLYSFGQTLDSVCALEPEHISCYGLIVEPGTPFYESVEELALPDEDVECDMYSLACDKLLGMGYEHYEISNYAKDGKYSRHNLKYWQDREYIGLGVAAHSYFHGVRYGRDCELSSYFSSPSPASIIGNAGAISGEDAAFEYAMLALRLKWGIDLEEYRRLFGVDFLEGRRERIAPYLSAGLARLCGDRFFLTERGFYISNKLMSDIL